MRKLLSPGAAFLLGLLALGLLPVATRALGGRRAERCPADGRSLGAAPSVRVELGGEGSRRFCGISCADRWLRTAGRAAGRIWVLDEESGREVPADEATFVRSVVARPTSGDRVHAFARRADAERHARAYAGVVLEGDARPFAARAPRPGAEPAAGSGP